MGQQHSTNEPLYKQFNRFNTGGIRDLYREGANIEQIDAVGRTPLIFACQDPDLFKVAETLIELGANVNAYRSGQHSGTPLHHAARNGLDRTVKLLLSHGANAFIVNDYSKTPLDLAKEVRYSMVVRIIENHISLFSGWMRDFSRSVSPELLVSKKVWVVVKPCGSLSPASPVELELAIYSGLQDAQPRLILALGKAIIGEPDFHQKDPMVILTYVSTNERLMLGPAKIGDKQQLEWFHNSCKGVTQEMPPALLNIRTPAVSASAPPAPPNFYNSIPANNMHAQPISSIYYDEGGPSIVPTDPILKGNDYIVASAPLAPLQQLRDESVSADLYPIVDSSPIDFRDASSEIASARTNEIKKQEEKEEKEKSLCTICESAPVEGACVPCGHMFGCMICLNKIKVANLGCPICRNKINQVIRLFAV